ncbi:MAG: hypothetical protein IJU76_14415 [Desulfovibrionaceae bacterium]|nr:hypothetical protein [Desulfovibrionaceae bacterium]
MKRLTFSLLSLFVFLLIVPAKADTLLEKILPAAAQAKPFHGNIESKVYHAPNCEFYSCKKCIKEFATEKQAQAEGYQPCSVCLGKQGEAGQKGKKSTELRGNPNTKVVHGPSCKYYASNSSSVTFRSKKEAEAAGYRLCTICNGK